MLEFGMNPQQALDAPRVYVHYDQKSKTPFETPMRVLRIYL